MLELEKRSPLAFPITLKDGRTLATVGDAADYLSALNVDQRERGYWKTAIMMFNNAMRLGLMPNSRNGADKGPRNGIGICRFCQQPRQIVAGSGVIGTPPIVPATKPI